MRFIELKGTSWGVTIKLLTDGETVYVYEIPAAKMERAREFLGSLSFEWTVNFGDLDFCRDLILNFVGRV